MNMNNNKRSNSETANIIGKIMEPNKSKWKNNLQWFFTTFSRGEHETVTVGHVTLCLCTNLKTLSAQFIGLCFIGWTKQDFQAPLRSFRYSRSIEQAPSKLWCKWIDKLMSVIKVPIQQIFKFCLYAQAHTYTHIQDTLNQFAVEKFITLIPCFNLIATILPNQLRLHLVYHTLWRLQKRQSFVQYFGVCN